VSEGVPDVSEGVPDVSEGVPDVSEGVPDGSEGVPDGLDVSSKFDCAWVFDNSAGLAYGLGYTFLKWQRSVLSEVSHEKKKAHRSISRLWL
jgi:hypothetical protein